MLSVNIPVYNIEVVELVDQLTTQAKKLKIPFEIRVYDDCSAENTKLKNRALLRANSVVYVELENNLGRAAIRNKMGLESIYEQLLFIDADSYLVKDNYLETFIQNTKTGRILCGGTAYSPEKPKQQEKLLRWVYGKEREAVSAAQRNSKKGFILTSNNFLIEKAVFEKIHFRENLKGYGHEDTLLGYDLFKQNFEILHIDNPVEHTGLENSQVFLDKTKRALENLKLVSEELLLNDREFIQQVNFLEKYHRFVKVLPKTFLSWCFVFSQKYLARNLTGSKPNLRCFDLYKLGFYATLKNR
jgi:glycosyltransferase involved in cell wall biosynthesis